MTSTNGRQFQLLGYRRRIPPVRSRSRWKGLTRRREHDPMLVFNMSVFNFAGGWNGLLGRLRQRGV
jgi:hypothetical protein